jgi:hypothetical protein
VRHKSAMSGVETSANCQGTEHGDAGAMSMGVARPGILGLTWVGDTRVRLSELG